MHFRVLVLCCFFTGALFQGAFFPNGADQIPAALMQEYFKFKELYRQKAATYDDFEYQRLKNSTYEDCRRELLNSNVDISGSSAVYLSALCKDALRDYFDTQSEERKQYAELLKVAVADLSMHNYQLREGTALQYFNVIYVASADDAMFQIAFDHLWRQVSTAAGQEIFIHVMTHLFDPEETKLKPVFGLRISNLMPFFERVFFRIKNLANCRTVTNAQSMAITMLQNDPEANMPLLKQIVDTFSFNKLQENAHFKLVFAMAAANSFSVLQLIPSNPKLKVDGSAAHDLANGAFQYLFNHHPDHFRFPHDSENFVLYGRKYNFTRCHDFLLSNLWGTLKALPLHTNSGVKGCRTNLRAFIIDPWYYRVTQPADYYHLVQYYKSAHRYAESKVQEFEALAQNGDGPAQVITTLNNWKYLSDCTLEISRLADYIEQN